MRAGRRDVAWWTARPGHWSVADMFRRILMSAVIFVSASLPPLAAAQESAGAITGVVRDQQGRAIPGATIQLVAEDGRRAVEAVSDELGSYRVAPAPGRYRLETTLDGFDAASRPIVVVGG